MRERNEEKILCLLTSPKSEGQPFGISVYAVGDKPRCVLKAETPRSEVLGFLSLIREGSAAEHMAKQSADSCM